MTQSGQAQIRSPHWVPLVTALIAAGAILLAVYPGFMSFDSLLELHEARTAVTGGDYPPFVSYVWRVFDAIWPGPSLMLLVQNFLLIASYAALGRTLGYRRCLIVIAVVLFCLAPPIVGPMLVVWKDVGVSAFLCAATACVLAVERTSNPRFMITAAIILLFFGSAFRMNAITAILPLVVWLWWERAISQRGRVNVPAASAATFAGIAVAVFVVNGVQFPSLARFPAPVGLKSVMVHDMAAMTALCGKNLMPSAGQASSGDNPVEYFRRIYDPRHTNLETANDREGRLWKALDLPDAVVYSAFLSALRNEPRAYVAHRTNVFRELVGLTGGPTLISTHPGVDANEEGVIYRPTRVSEAVIYYILTGSGWFFGKPWFYYLLGTMAFAIAIVRRKEASCAAAVAVYVSGVFYLLPFFFITPAADVRYNHWSIVCMFIVIAAAFRPAVRPSASVGTDPERAARVELPA
jgi:hypothetical protein